MNKPKSESELNKINSLVATEIMGFILTDAYNSYGHPFVLGMYDNFTRSSPFYPTVNLEQAYMVVEKLRSEGTYLDVRTEKEGYAVEIYCDDGEGGEPHHETANWYTIKLRKWVPDAEALPLAICLAAKELI